MVRLIPLALAISRAILGPAFILFAIHYPNTWIFSTVLSFAFFSDIIDGKIARRLEIADSSLRRLDSAADSIFYLSVGVSVWILFPELVWSEITLLLFLLFLEIVRYIFDAIKYGREASYHMWSAKFWGIVLFISSMGIFVFQFEPLLMMRVSLIVGILSDIEGIAISLILREWKHDVPTVWHALAIRAKT